MKRILNISIVMMFVMAISCQKDNEVDPKIETASITATSGTTMIASGNIVEPGSYPILTFGFAYSHSNYNFDLQSADTVSLGNKPLRGSFQKSITPPPSTSYYYSNALYVRAYITNTKGTVYGEVKSVYFPNVSVGSVSPMTGQAGDHITINGTNFSTNPSSNFVQFNETPAQVISATSTKLVVVVPSGVSNYYYSSGVNITIETESGIVTATQNFNLIPTITGMSPMTGTFGTSVTISGSNFRTDYYYNYSISLGGVSVYPSSTSGNSLTFTIPTNVTNEFIPVTVVTGGVYIAVPGTFTITKPTITSVSPITGIGGTQVTITGQNFNYSTYYSTGNTITVGGVNATIQSSNTSAVVFTVPNLSPGDYDISLSTGVHTLSPSQKFTVNTLQISGFQPQSATRGSYVTISGSNFGPSNYYNTSVYFGSTQVGISSWSTNSITVYLPTYMPQGTMQVKVNAGGQSAVAADSFTVL